MMQTQHSYVLQKNLHCTGMIIYGPDIQGVSVLDVRDENAVGTDLRVASPLKEQNLHFQCDYGLLMPMTNPCNV